MRKFCTAMLLMVSFTATADMPTIFKGDESDLGFFEITNKINKMRLSQVSDEDKSKTILMFGDSITQGLNPVGLHFMHVNLGIAGDTVHGIKARVKETDLGKWKAVYIEAGTNNLLMAEPGTLLGDEMTELIEYAATRSKRLFVSEIFIPNREKLTQIATDATVANLKIRDACAKYTSCEVVPLPAGMIKDSGIDPLYSLSDNTHLTGEAYKLWKVELNRAMAEFPYSIYYRYIKK